MPTEGEEIVGRSDLLDLQNAAPDARQRLFETGTRWDVFDFLVAS